MNQLHATCEAQGVSEEDWRSATEHCHLLRVARTVAETHDAVSLVLEVPPELAERFAYRAGQFLSFKVPHAGRVLVRSYSLASSPDTENEHKVTIKRVDDGRISNWMNDSVEVGSLLAVVPPAGLFVLDPGSERDIVLFAGGSGITPCISLLKTALATSTRRIELIYANRDARSIIFRKELDALRDAHPERVRIHHFLDDEHGFLCAKDVEGAVSDALDRDFFLCGPAAFMDVVEQALLGLGVVRDRIAVERFASPPDPESASASVMPAEVDSSQAPTSITLVLDGKEHEVPYTSGERVIEAARRAGLEPPFSCEEGYCSCCMAQLTSGDVTMETNDCLTPELVEEGWVLTCQSVCTRGRVRIEYPD